MTSALILIALLPSLLGVQASSSTPAEGVHTDGAVHPEGVRASVGGSGDNGTLTADADRVSVRIEVYENGTAHWRIENWVRLEDRAAERAFRLSDRAPNQGTDATERYYDRVRRGVEAAEDATGRNMSAAGFSTHTTVRRIPERYGVIVHTFRWEGFADASGERLRIGDALGGLYLGAGESISISWPEGYELAEVDPEPDEKEERSVVWHGPTVFDLDGPRLLVTRRSASMIGFFPLSVAIVAVAAALWWVGSSGHTPLTPPKVRAFDDESEESELLSNEEQVLRLLEDRGGRVRQHEVADELGWTPSKTSYVVSNLRDEGEIHTFRLGRENVLSLSDSRTTDQPKT